MNGDENDTSRDPHQDAAANAASGAGDAAGGSGQDAHTDHMLQLKRDISSDPALQAHLNEATTEDDFHDRLVALGAQRGASFNAQQSKDFLSKRATMSANEPPPPPETTGCTQVNCGGGYTHESSNWCTWNPLKC